MNDNYPKPLAQIENDTLDAQSRSRAIASIKKMTQRHRTEEAREECYQAIKAHLSRWIALEDLEKYLSLTDDFQLPVWVNYRNEAQQVGVDFRLIVPGHTEVGCTAWLRKSYGTVGIEVVSVGNYFARGNPHTYLGEALVTARRDWVYQQETSHQSEEYHRTAGQALEISENETEENEVPF